MSTKLARLTDAELNELFAVEVAGGHVASFCTDANAVLPFLAKWPSWDCGFDDRVGHAVILWNRETSFRSVKQPTFPRAAAIALLVAARASKGDATR